MAKIRAIEPSANATRIAPAAATNFRKRLGRTKFATIANAAQRRDLTTWAPPSGRNALFANLNGTQCETVRHGGGIGLLPSFAILLVPHTVLGIDGDVIRTRAREFEPSRVNWPESQPKRRPNLVSARLPCSEAGIIAACQA